MNKVHVPVLRKEIKEGVRFHVEHGAGFHKDVSWLVPGEVSFK